MNVALASNGATATASTELSGYEAATAIDGDRSGANWANGGHGGWNDDTWGSYPDWLQVDFAGGSKTIGEIDVFTLQDDFLNNAVEPTDQMTTTAWGIKDFDVQYWDGSAWVTVPGGGITGNNKVWRKISFSPLQTAKIRVSVNASLQNFSRITEVEAWTQGSQTATGSVFDAGSLKTSYSYDALDQLTTVTQGSQTRSFKYDSLGRLTRQKLAEQTATINDAGTYVGAGGTGALWSDAFAYDARSNITQRTDARGVKANFSYLMSGNTDPLNRLQSISYDTSTADTTYTINAAPSVALSYMTAGDQTRVASVTTAGVATETNGYDTEGRISSYTLTLANWGSYPMTTYYGYDAANRLTGVTYPMRYGVAGATYQDQVTSLAYDEASRLTGMSYSSHTTVQELLDGVQYNAFGQVTSLTTGTGSASPEVEQYGYDAQTGLLTSQSVTRASDSTTLLNLSYGYDRRNSNGSLSGKTGQLTHITTGIRC